MSQKIFTSEKDEELINLVKQNPSLYDCKLKSYKDIVIKNNIWKKIASTLNIPGKLKHINIIFGHLRLLHTIHFYLRSL